MPKQIISEVARQAIRFNPTSNTEVNLERMPDPESTKTMELRYREEIPLRAGEGGRFLVGLALLLLSASLSASLYLIVPDLAQQLWQRMETMDGLQVIGGLLLGMVALVGLLSLVFVPDQIRRALFWLNLPAVAGAFAIRKKVGVVAIVPLLVGCLAAAIAWRKSQLRFHEQWLLRAASRITSHHLNEERWCSSTWGEPQLA